MVQVVVQFVPWPSWTPFLPSRESADAGLLVAICTTGVVMVLARLVPTLRMPDLAVRDGPTIFPGLLIGWGQP